MKEKIEKISLDWFLSEPALFKVLCSHEIVPNTAIDCPVRCGKRRIEYCPALCKRLPDETFRELVKVECIRILLKHPYERQPAECSPRAVVAGSDCVLTDNYSWRHVRLSAPGDYGLESGHPFEYYARRIELMLNPSDGDGSGSKGNSSKMSGDDTGSQGVDREDDVSSNGSSDASSGQSGLWEENSMAAAEVNELIQTLAANNSWGSLTGSLAGLIIASTRVKIDYRRVMQSFRADILSSKRRLTRMRPNRRSGFQNFGSVYRLSSRLLVAIDVSGSTSDEMVSDFLGIVNKFFKYGIEEIDVIQFDSEIKGDPVTLKKAHKTGFSIEGRGGTLFQPIIDYANEHKAYYQGLIILTDGYAPHPVLPSFFRTPLLWVLPDEEMYEAHKTWMREYGKACFIDK